MTIVVKINDQWQPAVGVLTLTRTVSTAIMQFADGRTEEVACDPYPVEETLDLDKVAALVAQAVWGEAELAPYGLKVAPTFIVPEGQERVGQARFVEQPDGSVTEEWDLEVIPPHVPDPEPTPAEKLAALGLTVDELRELLGQ